jgi:hypothetical protein
MALYSVYRWRTRSGSRSGVVRVWQGEATSEAQAVMRAAQAQRARPGYALFARKAGEDPYADDPRTIVEEP